MPFNTSSVMKQVLQDGNAILALQESQQAGLELAVELYRRATADVERWANYIRRPQKNSRYQTYANPDPASHPLSLPYDNKPTLPDGGYCVVATDSSFLDSDKHRGAYCRLINVGRVMIRYGAERQADLSNRPIHCPDYLLPVEERYSASRALQAECVAYEMEDLTSVAGQHEADIALFDGPINQTVVLQPEKHEQGSKLIKEHLDRYYQHLESFAASNRLLVGYNSRTNSNLVMRSLTKAADLGMFKLSEDEQALTAMFAYLDDGDLFREVLPSGGRSHTYSVWQANAAQAGDGDEAVRSGLYDYQISFGTYYLNVADDPVRVDLPDWCLDRSDRAHELILSQCSLNRGYPIALNTAHFQALLNQGEDRESYFALLRKGGVLRDITAKARAKWEHGGNI